MKTICLLALTFIVSLSNPDQANASDQKFLSFSQKDINIAGFERKEYEDKYFTIGSIEVKELGSESVLEDGLKQDEKGLGEIIMAANKLLAFGKKVWEIIEAGRPVANTNMGDAISVLPNVDGSDRAFYDMENWSAPMVRKYRVEYKNLFGSVVVAFTYSVIYQYNGTYDGKGKYLTGVTINASDVQVSWGFEFNASSSLVAISNRGSKSNPLAAATLKINYSARSILKEIKSSETIHVAGNGQFIKY